MRCTEPETRVARTGHVCHSCGESIDPGQAYVFWTAFEDTATRNKMHKECYAAHEQRAREEGADEWEFARYGHARGSTE